MDPLLGTIIIAAMNFAPNGYYLCDGRHLPINQYQALFALLGTTYGGNGTTDFALPKLAAPAPGLQYIIAWQGVFPQRP